jgi:hypothetical protein
MLCNRRIKPNGVRPVIEKPGSDADLGRPPRGARTIFVVITCPGFGYKSAMTVPPIKLARNVAKIELLTKLIGFCVHIRRHCMSTNVDTT